MLHEHHPTWVTKINGQTMFAETLNNFTLTTAGFSIEGGTRRLIAAYFGIYSRLLCV